MWMVSYSNSQRRFYRFNTSFGNEYVNFPAVKETSDCFHYSWYTTSSYGTRGTEQTERKIAVHEHVYWERCVIRHLLLFITFSYISRYGCRWDLCQRACIGVHSKCFCPYVLTQKFANYGNALYLVNLMSSNNISQWM